MRGEKRIKAIHAELELLERQLNLKLMTEAAFVKSSEVLNLEINQIIYKNDKQELEETEEHLGYLQRHLNQWTTDYLVYMAANPDIMTVIDSQMKMDESAIKRTKKHRTLLLTRMKKLSKTV